MKRIFDAIFGSAIIVGFFALFIWGELTLINWAISAHLQFWQVALFGAFVSFVIIAVVGYLQDKEI